MTKKYFIRTISILVIIVACLTCFFLVSNQNKAKTFQDFYLNTTVSFTFYHAKDYALKDECFVLCEKYENLFSKTVEGSDIYNINNSKGEWVTIHPETYVLLETAFKYCELTDGAIDFTISPLMDLWNFTQTSAYKKPPSKEALKDAISSVDYRCLKLSNNKARLTNPNASIDLGFIAKGYIGDKIREHLVQKGVTSAIINLGGNILTIGSKPDNTPYSIGIRNPFIPSETIQTLKVTDRCVTTSGTYERCFIYQNTNYHHILDTETGMPVNNGLVSVTIISDDTTTGDALSTTCLILGKEKGLEFLKSFENINAVFIEENGQITFYPQ